MTREEARAIIRKEYLCVDRDCDIERSCGKCDLMMPSKEPILEAYNMAIKALEQEPFMNKPCISEGVCHDSAVQMLDKAIFRQYAIDTFNRWAEFKDYTHVERHILHAVVDELRAMPSISEQPDEWTPILKDLYDGMAERGNHDRME